MLNPTGDVLRDTATLQDIFDKGGRIPPGRWRFLGPLLYPLTPTMIEMDGVALEYVAPRPGWNSGFAICSRGYLLRGRPRARGLRINFGRTGVIELPERFGVGPRKGLGITDSDDAAVFNVRVNGPKLLPLADNRLFALQIHNSSDVTVHGGHLGVVNNAEGADGIHLTGTCRRVNVARLSTLSGDDGSSLTHEEASRYGDVLEDVTFTDCAFDNYGHSAVKGFIPPYRPGTTIRRWKYVNCDLMTRPTRAGAGAPVSIRALTGKIELISIEGGRLRVAVPSGGGVHESMVMLQNVRGFTLRNTAIEYYSRSVLTAVNCPNLIFAPGSIRFAPGIRAIPRNHQPLVNLTDCPGNRIVLPYGATQSAWPGQLHMMVDGRPQ